MPRWRPREARRRVGQAYSRRGLVHHRILPNQVLGLPVRLVTQDTMSGPDAPAPAGVRFGAALFEGLSLRPRRVETGFVVDDVTCPDQEATVRRQLRQAVREGCFGAVWPELTIKPVLRRQIEDDLRGRALDPDPNMNLQIVVAGSWHQARGGAVANVATIFDGYGRQTLEYSKLISYVDRELGVEAIERGNEIPILTTDEISVAFAVCRDFCDAAIELPHPQLDVDFVIVPSMGDDETMRGHCATAKLMRVRYGALTFVVQQREPSAEAEGWLGMVLPMLDNPTDVAMGDLRQTVEWASHVGNHEPKLELK